MQILKIKKIPLKVALSKDSAVEGWRNISYFAGKVPGKLTPSWIVPWPVTDEWDLNKKGWWKVEMKNSDDRAVSSLAWVLLLALKEPSQDDVLLSVIASQNSAALFSTAICCGIQFLIKLEIIVRVPINAFVGKIVARTWLMAAINWYNN